MLESPDKTGDDMSLSGEGGDLPDKVILKRNTKGWPGGGVFEAREEYCFLQIAFMVMCHRTV